MGTSVLLPKGPLVSSPVPSDSSSRQPTHRADPAVHEPTEPLHEPATAQSAPQGPRDNDTPPVSDHATPVGEETALGQSTASLPDFSGPTAAERELSAIHREVLGTGKDVMGTADAEEFVREVGREHRNNLVSITLVLAAPAFLFATLWWPFGISPAASFGEANPTLATVVGLSLALVVIVLGVVAHFAPRGRHDILERVDQGNLLPSTESAEYGGELRSTSRSRMLLCRILGALCALAAVACVILVLGAFGNPMAVFGYLALAFVATAAAFAFFYVPFTIRRTARQLGA